VWRDPMTDSPAPETTELYLVHWPGKDVIACEDHMRKLVGLGAVLGTRVSWSHILNPQPGPECLNCANEAKKESR
jgi:hypothetical protein